MSITANSKHINHWSSFTLKVLVTRMTNDHSKFVNFISKQGLILSCFEERKKLVAYLMKEITLNIVNHSNFLCGKTVSTKAKFQSLVSNSKFYNSNAENCKEKRRKNPQSHDMMYVNAHSIYRL